ncbi:hypothetical protein [Poseidonocella sp. HB161398]|uniref:hypothetical protein n=1 Tax=Poseidonocella sp. HB161398 TaxID=2320855 RepID=UPI001109357B|nr:hypothetical protein [Poseidonocella sp. HB161398]
MPDDVLALDPLAGPMPRAIAHRREICEAAGERPSSGQLEELLGISRQGIDKRRRASRVLGIRTVPDGICPALQFLDGQVPALLGDRLRAHAGDDPWHVLDALMARHGTFGGRSLLDLAREEGRSGAPSRS